VFQVFSFTITELAKKIYAEDGTEVDILDSNNIQTSLSDIKVSVFCLP
jgi:hypothetical protein